MGELPYSAPAQAEMKRVEWIDTARGFAIVLVVIGHALRGLVTAGIMPENGAARIADQWIYAFHMPLFFLLAGLFVPHFFKSKLDLQAFLAGKCRTVLYPYFLWSILTILLKSNLGEIPNTPRSLLDLPKVIYSPIEQYWFLYALFLIFLLYGLMRWIGAPIWAIFGISAILCVLHPQTGWPILDLTLTEAGYFLIGVLISKHLLKNSEWLSSKSIVLLGLGCALVPLAVQLQPVAALAGISFSIVLAHLLPDRMRFLFPMLGRYSLEIFLLHSIVSAAVRVALLHAGIALAPIHLFVGCVAGIFIPLALGIVSRTRFPYLFTLSDSSIKR